MALDLAAAAGGAQVGRSTHARRFSLAETTINAGGVISLCEVRMARTEWTDAESSALRWMESARDDARAARSGLEELKALDDPSVTKNRIDGMVVTAPGHRGLDDVIIGRADRRRQLEAQVRKHVHRLKRKKAVLETLATLRPGLAKDVKVCIYTYILDMPRKEAASKAGVSERLSRTSHHAVACALAKTYPDMFTASDGTPYGWHEFASGTRGRR